MPCQVESKNPVPVYLIQKNATFEWQWHLSDHLGNSRVCFTDKDGDGVIEIAENEVLEDSHYYPFGLEQKGAFSQNLGRENKYLYNGNELQSDFGLNTYDFNNRMYDPAIGRFPSIDRFAEKFAQQSPYTYAGNNPISFIDVNGDSLKINFVGEYAEHSENEFYGIVNNSLEGQFTLSPNSSENLQLVATKDGSYENLSKQGKAVYDQLSSVTNHKSQVTITADYANSSVHTGRFDKSTLDVADILQFNSDKTQLGGTQIGKIIHEVIEQADKQISSSGFNGAHENAIIAENAVNNSKRTDDRNAYGVQKFSRGDRTVTNRISTSKPGSLRTWFMSTNRRVISINKTER